MIATIHTSNDVRTFTNLTELHDYLDYLENNGISFHLTWEPKNE
jgi:hypothetical protein